MALVVHVTHLGYMCSKRAPIFSTQQWLRCTRGLPQTHSFPQRLEGYSSTSTHYSTCEPAEEAGCVSKCPTPIQLQSPNIDRRSSQLQPFQILTNALAQSPSQISKTCTAPPAEPTQTALPSTSLTLPRLSPQNAQQQPTEYRKRNTAHPAPK